jgi:hypothetical protein
MSDTPIPTPRPFEPYARRAVRPVDVWRVHGWKVKAYSIAVRRELARPELVDAMRKLVAGRLPRPAVSDAHHGAAFACAHDGETGEFVFLCWWENENELAHVVWGGAKGSGLPERGTHQTRSCVWEAAVLCHERNAWLRHVLANPAGPDLDAYFADVLSEDV